jgi:hypothetical protein
MRVLLLAALLTSTAAADDKVTKTKVLDLELLAKGSSYVLRDAAFEVTFPGRPEVAADPIKAADGTEMTFANATLDRGNLVLMIGLMPSPRDKAYDAKKGIAGARDMSIARMKGKLVSETATKIDGRDARHVVATVTVGTRTARVDEYLMWDADHRMAVLLMTLVEGSKESADGKAFVASYKRVAGSHSPLDPPLPAEGLPVATGALDFDLVRNVGAYTLRDAAVEMTFPSRPVVTSAEVAPATAVLAETALDEVDSVGAGVIVVPAGAKYEPKKEMSAVRDRLLTSFTKVKSKEKAVKISGVDGKRVTFTGKSGATTMQGEINIVWSPQHRMLVVVYAYTGGKKHTAAEREFLDSLVIHPKGKPPALPATK